MPYFCYLLRSLSSPTSAYVGFTANPRRRLRQHNGEIKNGARKTSKRRPWIHVAIISGFPNKIVALQFEWQWQHPKLSRIIRNQFDFNAHTRGWKMNVKILNIMLKCPLWNQLHLTAHFIFPEAYTLFQSLQTISSSSLTVHARLEVLEYFDDIVIKKKPIQEQRLHDGRSLQCYLCAGRSGCVWTCLSETCDTTTHISCACSQATAGTNALLPSSIVCHQCGYSSYLIEIVNKSFILQEGRVSLIDLTDLHDGAEGAEEEEENTDDDDLESDCSDFMSEDDNNMVISRSKRPAL